MTNGGFVKHTRTRVAAIAASALLIPASAAAAHGRPDFAGAQGHHDTAQARPEHAGSQHGNRHKHPVAFVFTGTVTAAANGTLLTVHVLHGNHWAKHDGFVGQDVTFDLANAHLSVADTDGTPGADAGDFKAGDRVVILAKLPRDTAFSQGEQPLVARHVADRTNRTAGSSSD
jgi:hypothetical protein